MSTIQLVYSFLTSSSTTVLGSLLKRPENDGDKLASSHLLGLLSDDHACLASMPSVACAPNRCHTKTRSNSVTSPDCPFHIDWILAAWAASIVKYYCTNIGIRLYATAGEAIARGATKLPEQKD